MQGTRREQFEAFRFARDQIRDRVLGFLVAASRDELRTPEAVTLG